MSSGLHLYRYPLYCFLLIEDLWLRQNPHGGKKDGNNNQYSLMGQIAHISGYQNTFSVMFILAPTVMQTDDQRAPHNLLLT